MRSSQPVRVLWFALVLMAGAFIANVVLHAWSVADNDVPRYMSEWAARRQAILWSAQLAMMATAAALVAWVAWPLCTTRPARVVASTMAAVAISMLLVALVPADGKEGWTLQEGLHSLASVPAFVTMIAAPGAAWAARRDVSWVRHARLSLIAAALAAVTGIAMASSKFVGSQIAGPLERIPVIVIVAWFAIVALGLIRHLESSAAATTALADASSASSAPSATPVEPDGLLPAP